MRVAVIGGGIVGAAVAHHLARGGASVTLFEQHHLGAGATGASFAWVNSNGKHPEAYHRLNVEGCAEHQRLATETTDSPAWYFPTGHVTWAGTPDGVSTLEQRVSRLSTLNYPCRWIDRDEANHLEPDLRIPTGVETIAYFPDEGYVLPALMVARLLGEARDRGAHLAAPARVAAIEASGHAATVVLDDGQRERFDRVVSCTGRWTEELAGTLGAYVPLASEQRPDAPASGILACTRPLPVRISRVLTTPRINLRPDGGGRLMLHSPELDVSAGSATGEEASQATAHELACRLDEVLDLGQSAIESLRIGRRVLPADGLTVCGFTGEERRVYVVATHSGITLAPLLGRLVGAEMLEESESALLAGFRPDRFAHVSGGASGPREF